MGLINCMYIMNMKIFVEYFFELFWVVIDYKWKKCWFLFMLLWLYKIIKLWNFFDYIKVGIYNIFLIKKVLN